MNPRLPAYLFIASLILLTGLVVLYFNFPQPRQNEALVGGPFELVTHRGETVTHEDYSDRYMLLYFGYTFCPDVCPTELQKMALALNLFEDQGGDMDALTPLFITIDPERDTREVMADYVAAFHPRLTGLTGSNEQIAKAAKAWRVHYSRGDDPGDGSYLMDHSSIIFLMDENSRYIRHFTLPDSPEYIADILLAVTD